MAYAVLTRDAVDAEPYARALRELGLRVIPTPFMRFAAAPDPDALRRALVAGGHARVIVTSPRAAAALIHVYTAVPGLALPPAVAVGEATRRVLGVANLVAEHPEGVRDGVELARWLTRGAPERVLMPRAEGGRDEPIAILRAAGWDVDDVVAYRSVAIAPDDPVLARGCELLVTGGAALCVVFAPSQVAALAAALGARGCALRDVRVAWAAIGETTAAALRAAGVLAVAVADAPTPEGIAKAARAVYRSEP